MKKLTTLLLTITMLISISTTALAVDYGAEYQKLPTPQTVQKFSDVPTTHWAFDYIGEMAQRDVISGYPDGRFIPENQVTRAEFAKIMVCAAGLRVENNYTTSFNDVYTSDWYCPYVECAKDYLTGYSTNTGTIYKPTTPALREDIAVALVKLKGYDISLADESILNMFTDSYSISSSARKYVTVAVERGIVSGYENNTFRGQATITRAEAATLLWRAFQYGNDNKIVETSGSGIQNSGTTVPSNETGVPTPTPTVQGNDGAVSSNNGAVLEPTPTPETTERPYKVDTLVKADVDSNLMTFDENGKVYYVENNKIYSVDTNKQKEEIVDVDSLAIEKDFDKQSFELEDICYDLHSRKLYIVGKYSGEPRKLYILNNKSLEEYDGYAEHLLVILEDDKYVGTIWADGVPRTTSFIQPEGAILSKDAVISIVETDDNLIYATADGIYEYDWNTSTKIADSTSHVGVSKNGYVISKNNEFIIRSFNGNEIRINKDDYKINDKSAFDTNNMVDELFLTPNNNIIFYDTNAKAFRMISEN